MTNLFLAITWNIDPVLFDFGIIKIHYYSLMWILAFVIGWYLMKKMMEIDKIDIKLLDPLFLYAFLGVIIGARLGELFYNFDTYQGMPVDQALIEVFLPVQRNPESSAFFGLLQGYEFSGFRGLASHGAALGFLLSSYLFNRKYLKKNLLWLLDRVAITVPLGGAAIRVGNFINSEIVGKPSDLPWAVKFVQQSAGYGDNLIARHPAQLYEAICYVIIFFILWHFYRKTDKKYHQGYIFGLFFTLLWSVRFFVEFFKENQGDEFVAQSLNIGLNNGQILSIPFIIVGIIVMFTSKNRIYKD
ncbi:prolipoprotein diacylglyceryl transferase [Moheibacter sp.]|uniref:prolipoprotein diacylglyceryl transferase n=1 Tax=Moheibacter sp. TaxID=1965316 RepID=UPI003C760AD7